MNDLSGVIDKLTPIFQQLSEKLGQGGAWTFALYVRQQVTIGVSYLVWSVPVAVLAGLCWFFTFKYDEETEGASLLLLAPALFFTIWVCFNLDSGVMHLLNPQYYALQDLIGTFIPQAKS